MICMGTRLMQGDVLMSKDTDHIASEMDTRWFGYFGYPKILCFDRAEETTSRIFMRICDVHQIQVQVTPAQAPFANGTVERHQAVVKETMKRMREDLPNASVQILLHKALTAHNTLANIDGVSPIQRATGLSPSLPSVLTDSPASAAARENVRGNIPTYLDRLHVAVLARKAFNKAQMSRKLTRAIAHISRQESPIDCAKDGQVLFWNVSVDAKQRGWRGPARVVTIDLSSKTVEMAYGAQCITRHTSKVKRVAEMRAVSMKPGMLRADEVPMVELASIELRNVSDWNEADGVQVAEPIVQTPAP